MASRRKSRILAFQALYFWESNRVPVEELVSFAWLDEEKLKNLNEEMSAFARLIITGTIENIDAVDEMIKKHLQNWDISRLNRVDLAVLRISAYTLMFQKDIQPSIVIDEAIGICVEFGANDSFKFVNGVLDSVRITLQKNPEAQT
jgi:transcription antitermination protein NusB